MRVSEAAPIILSGSLGKPLANLTAAEWIATWCADPGRVPLLDFSPAPGKPGVPGMNPGAGGLDALLDLAKHAGRWMAGRSEPTVTVAMLEDMTRPVAEGGLDNQTWLCSPFTGPGDPRQAILDP